VGGNGQNKALLESASPWVCGCRLHQAPASSKQVDYLLTRFNEGAVNRQNQNNLRVSTGVVFHF